MNKETVNRLITTRKNPAMRKYNANIGWGWGHIQMRLPANVFKMANNDPYGEGMGEYMAEVEMEIAKYLSLGRRMDWPEEVKQYVADTIRWKAWHMIVGEAPRRGGKRRRTRRRSGHC